MDQTPIFLNEHEKELSSSQDKIDLFGKDFKITWTSGREESLNQILFSTFLEVARKTGKIHFVTMATEDKATLQAMKRLEELGCFVKIAPVTTSGEVDLFELKKLISDRTALVSLSLAHPLTGVLQPIDEIEQIAKEKNVLLHLDVSFAIGKFYFSFEESSADFFSYDKVILSKESVPLAPLILGKAEKPDPDFILDTSHKLARADEMSLELSRLSSLLERNVEGEPLLREAIKLPGTIVLAFPGVHQEALHTLLKRKQIFTQIGGTRSQHLSSLLKASRQDHPFSALSFSIPSYTREEDVEKAAIQIQEGAQFLKKVSGNLPVYEEILPPISNRALLEKMEKLPFSGSLKEKEGMRLLTEEKGSIRLSLLVDETDGVIADIKYSAAAPSTALILMELTSSLLMRKTYAQASRISGEMIFKELKTSEQEKKGLGKFINQILSLIENLTEKCTDITCSQEFDNTPIYQEMGDGTEIEGFETFPLEKRKSLIEAIIDKEIRPYVEMDAGGVKIVDLNEEHELTISYQGACTSCHSATGSTLSAIQQILRDKAFKKITVIPSF